MNRHDRSRPRQKLTALLLAMALTSSSCGIFSDAADGEGDTTTTLSGGDGTTDDSGTDSGDADDTLSLIHI